jgi:hypothetical protein
VDHGFLPQDLEGQGDRRDGSDQQERPADRLPLVGVESVRQKEADPGAKSRPCAGDQAEFR